MKIPRKPLALWAVTRTGAKLAQTLSASLPEARIYLPETLKDTESEAIFFARLKDAVAEAFNSYENHIFIMSTGIVVRMIAPLIRDKTIDPAVVVMDEKGLHAVSLLSGHIGGANELAVQAARIVGAAPVITTATDIQQVPAIDVIAKNLGLHIENPQAIRYVSMALLNGGPIFLHDPFELLTGLIPDAYLSDEKDANLPGVYVDDRLTHLPEKTLILRPKSLAAGMGCNRNTQAAEMKDLLFSTLDKFGLSVHSLNVIASVDLKKDEQDLLALAEELSLPLIFFDKDRLKAVTQIQTPSEMVQKHIGVPSVCEAAAILAADNGPLIAAKHSTRNVTVAIARKRSISSASAPAERNTCADKHGKCSGA
jgi:cobalt-precorrin 5A hydrolase